MTDEIKKLCETAQRWHEEIVAFGEKTALTKKDLTGLRRRIELAQEAEEEYRVALGVVRAFIDKERC